MNLFSNKDYRFDSLEELQMEKFQLQLRIQLLKEDLKKSAVDVRNSLGIVALKGLAIPVAAKIFTVVYQQFVSPGADQPENSANESRVSAIPSILKGIKQGLDIYERVTAEYNYSHNSDF